MKVTELQIKSAHESHFYEGISCLHGHFSFHKEHLHNFWPTAYEFRHSTERCLSVSVTPSPDSVPPGAEAQGDRR